MQTFTPPPLHALPQSAQHITATERKSILTMLNNGWLYCTNRPRTKQYTVIQGTPLQGGKWEYKIEVRTRETTTIGAPVTTTKRTVKFIYNK
jgi:hypothetical protein